MYQLSRWIIILEKCEVFNKILTYNQDKKSMKILFAIYPGTEPLFEKIRTCGNNPEKSFTTKVNKHTACGCSIFIQCSIDGTLSKRNFYTVED